MEQRFKVEKPETVKIVQVVSQTPEVRYNQAMSISNYHYKVVGLGSDSRIYEHDEYRNTWHCYEIREVPDACTCAPASMPCWFCTRKVIDTLDSEIANKL